MNIMKKSFKNKALKFFAAGVLLQALLGFNAMAQGFTDRVLVIVNEDVVTQSEFDYRIRTLLQDLRTASKPIPPNLPKQLLDTIVNERLQVQEANRRGIEISDAQLEEAIERFAGQQNISVDQLRQSIAESGQPFKLFQESVRDSLTISRFTEYYARTRVIVPEYEIDGVMDSEGLNADNSEYHIAQILIKDPDANAELAKQVRAELDSGTSFSQAALQYSELPNAQEGGVLGWRRKEQLPDVFVDAIKNIQVGEVSNVISTPNGLHILKLLDRRGDERTEIVQSEVRHILIKAESTVAKSQASKRLNELKKRIAVGEDFSELARIYSDDTASAATGGSLGWVSPGQMVPPFEQRYESLALGEVSEPVATQFGMHIILVEDRRKKDVTEQIMRNQIADNLRRQRADREFSQWVRELLEGAYIEHVAEPVPTQSSSPS